MNAFKMPMTAGMTDGNQNDIVGVRCRKIGRGRATPWGYLVTVDECASCPLFEPAVRLIRKQDDPLEGNDGIDQRTGNSYATCKYFGEIVHASGARTNAFGARKVV
jgi:hypothetical protein